MVAVVLSTTVLSCCVQTSLFAQLVVDRSYKPEVQDPLYSDGDGPLVLVDSAHDNGHTIHGRYRPFAELLRADGYNVQDSNLPLTDPTTREQLEETGIFVIANANRSLASEEVDVIVNWVHAGGSLLFIFDHPPVSGFATNLAAAFQVEIFTDSGINTDHISVFGSTPPGCEIPGCREEGWINSHFVTRGRHAGESVESVATFVGSGFVSSASQPILTFGPDAVFDQGTSAEGILQGAVMRFGSGRVYLSGEAAMFTAQIWNATIPVGLTWADNEQYLLNIMHWLDAGFLISPQIVEVPDPGLRAAIRLALGKHTGDITGEDMEGLTELDASVFVRESSTPIRSLEGLETARNLTSLNLKGDYDIFYSFINIDIEDFSPLADLPRLSTLNLSANALTSLSLPEGMTALTTLDLSYNGLISLNLPEGLGSLTSLNLSWNNAEKLSLPKGRLTDFSFLEGLTNLTMLDLSYNGLTNLSLPEGLSSLTTLDLSGNSLSDFSFLEGLSSLITLDLEGNGLSSLTLPEGLSSLTTLDLSYNRLKDFVFLEVLTKLSALDLSYNDLTNLALPEGMTSLLVIKLDGNQLITLSLPYDLNLRTLSLSGVTAPDFTLVSAPYMLTTLDLSGNRLTNLTLPERLENLTTLDLSRNDLTTLALPDGLTSLTILDLSLNDLATLSLPEELNNLATLNLGGNNLTDLTFPGSLENLTELHLWSNDLKSLTLPQRLNHLQVLDLGGNALTSLTWPEGLEKLTELHLWGNNFVSLDLPSNLDSLSVLTLSDNNLTNFNVPDGLVNLTELRLWGNELSRLTLPEGLKNLTTLDIRNNRLTDLILPEGLDRLVELHLDGNPLTLLAAPVSMELDSLSLYGFEKSNTILYIPLEVARFGNQIEITWPEGVLQSKDTIGGLWSDVEGAASPHSVDVFEPQQFFRVRSE